MGAEAVQFHESRRGSPQELFSQRARITRIRPEAINYMDLAAFRNMAEELLEVGAFTSFYEREVARRADRLASLDAFESRRRQVLSYRMFTHPAFSSRPPWQEGCQGIRRSA
jgi:hypothetical protein